MVRLCRIAVKHRLHKGHTLTDRHRRQVHTVRHIAYGINARDFGLAVVIHQNFAIAAQLHTDGLKAHVLRVWRTARGKHNLLKDFVVSIR